jgi:alpha-L-fucosidase 2
MKKFPFYSLLLFVFFFGGNTVFAESKSLVKLQVNWSEYLSKHDLVWNRIPENYYEGAYVGNGLLGAILCKDNQKKNTLRFEIGRSDVYDHRSVANGFDPFSRVRLPIGQLLLTPT